MMEIKVVHYTKRIKKNTVLDDVSICLQGGKIYGFRGQNGCGKTMLMRAISGLIKPTKGYVEVNGLRIGRDIDFPKSIGVLIENPSFIGDYNAYDNLQVLAKLKGGIKKDEIYDVLKQVLLDPDNKKPYQMFSLGMKQKLGVAAAIMGKPEIIILDEPINALDEEAVQQIKQVLTQLKDPDRIIIMACHDREELDYLADEIILMKDGRMEGIENENMELSKI